MNRTIKLILIIVFLFNLNAYSQNTEIDSLENLLANHPQIDTVRIDLLNNIAYKLNSLDAAKSLRYATIADSLSDILGYIKGKASSFNTMGIYYYFKSDYTKALEYYDKTLKIGLEIKDKKIIGRSFNNSGLIYMFRSDYNKALECYNRKLEMDIEFKDSIELCKTYNNIGIVYYYIGDYPRSMDYYQKTMKIGEKLNAIDQLRSAYQNIGMIYNKQKEYQKAMEYYQKAYKIEIQLGNKKGMSEDCIGIGVLYFNTNNYTEALNYYQKAINISEEINDEIGLAVCYSNIGEIYSKQNDYITALKYLQKALSFSEKLGAKNYIASHNILLCEYYYHLKKYSTAIPYGLKAYNTAIEIGSKEKIRDAAEKLSNVYAAIGSYKEAYKFQVEFKIMNDSIYNEDNTKKMTTLENKYEFEKEKDSIANVQFKKDAIKEAEIKQQKLVRNFFIIGFVLMIIFALIIFRNLLINRKKNQQLAIQKQEIHAQANELEVKNKNLIELSNFKKLMTDTIIHDLKNPLNYIIGNSADKTIKQTGYNMLNIVLNILDINKAKATRLSINFETQNIDELVDTAISQVEFLAEQKNLNIEKNIDNEFKIQVDKDLTIRILVNLLTNAIKFSPLNNKITIQATEQNGFVKIDVIDYGKGISEENLNLIFNEYTQIEAKKSGKIQSTGIGLTFCKIATEAQNAKISVNSIPSEKTCFSLTFPLISFSEKISKMNEETKTETLLSLDDKENIQHILLKLTKIEIYKVSEILRLLNSIEDTSENVKRWKHKLKTAMYASNNELYNKLINNEL